MPPKKKKKGGKKKGKKKDDATLEMEEKFKKTLTDVEALKDHLTVRKELTRRAQSSGSEWRTRMQEAKDQLQDQELDQRDITSDLTRQYKTMQSELNLKLQQTEKELSRTTKELDGTRHKLEKTQALLEKTTKEKDEKITELQMKIDTMEIGYKGILQNALENLKDKIKESQAAWTAKSMTIQGSNKQALLEFDLNPQDL